jgi:polyisoprenoid-binding protein YceI
MIYLWVIAAAAAQTFSIQTDKSLLRFHIVHKLHKVDGESHAVEAKAAVSADGNLQVMARAAVNSFKSGDGNRDEHMLETLEAQKFPQVTLKASVKFEMPKEVPASQEVSVQGELEFHGKKQKVTVPLTLAWNKDGDAHATGTLAIGLDSFGIERPSLLLVKIDDECKIDIDLWMHKDAHP